MSGEKEREDEAGHLLALPSLRAKRSNPFVLSRRDGLLRFARNDGLEKKRRARPWGDRWKPRALWKEEVGSLLFSADVNAVTSDAE